VPIGPALPSAFPMRRVPCWGLSMSERCPATTRHQRRTRQVRVGQKFDYVFSIVWVGFKQDRNTAFDAPDARGIMVCMRSGRTDYKRGMGTLHQQEGS